MDKKIKMTGEEVRKLAVELEKNMEQSAKSKSGLQFNRDVTAVLKRLDNGKSVVFIKEEPSFARSGSKQCWLCKPIFIKMDHSFLIVDDDKKEIIYVLSDGTTTYRKDRARGKCTEGVNQYILKSEIEEDLFESYPQYRDYKIAHTNIFIFPSKMNETLKNLDYECKSIKTFCINTNYGTNEFRSSEGCHQIDAAMTIAELEEVVREIAGHPSKYSFTKDTIAHVWTKLFNSYHYQPLKQLTIENVRKDKNHIIYCLQKAPREYSAEMIDEFAKECGLKLSEKLQKKQKIQMLITHIFNNM